MSALNETERGYVAELRARLKDRIPAAYDTDFNLYRWVLNADRMSRRQGNVDLAEKTLKRHLRFRKALKLDEKPVPPLDENPMFIERYQSKPVLHYLPSNNCYLAWMDYSTFDTVGILHKLTTTEMLLYSFWFYENLLEAVNDREAQTGYRSGIYLLMDVKGYEMNPWTIMFASNGTLAQLIQVFAYENYPEVVFPYSVINLPNWLLWPIKVIRAGMPKDFNERFLLFDGRYEDALLTHMTAEELPKPLGGRNPCSEAIQPVPSRRILPTEYYQHKASNDPHKSQLAHLQVHAGQRKFIPFRCSSGSTLAWFFTTDGEINFGVYYKHYRDGENLSSLPSSDEDVLEKLEMVQPHFRIGAKLVPERCSIECEENGVYYFVFCNKRSWFYKRNVYLRIEVDGKIIDKKALLDSTFVA